MSVNKRIDKFTFDDGTTRADLDLRTFFPPNYMKIVDELPPVDRRQVGTLYLVTGKVLNEIDPALIYNLSLLNSNTTFWVSNNGSDENEGTQDKPFRSLQKVFEYINARYFVSSTSSVIIQTPDDEQFEDTSSTLFWFTSGFTRNVDNTYGSSLTIRSGANGSIKLRQTKFTNMCLRLDGDFIFDEFLQLDNTELVTEVGSNLTVKNTDIVVDNGLMVLKNGAKVTLNHTDLNLESNVTQHSALYLTEHSMLHADNASTLTFSTNVDSGTLDLSYQSSAEILGNMSGSITGKRYLIRYYSAVVTDSGNTKLPPGSEDGELVAGYYD